MEYLTDDLAPYLSDASNLPGGHLERVWVPASEQDVQEVVRSAFEQNIGLTIAGAGTGLVGGRVPFGGECIAMHRLNTIYSVDSVARRAKLQPGVILQHFQERVASEKLLYPPDPTESGSQIGGNVATNASGAKTFRYGPTRDWIESLRVVLPDGDVLALSRGEQMAVGRDLLLTTESGRTIDISLPDVVVPKTSKHAAGYYVRPNMDGIELLIGSEGTLGIITEIECRLTDLPDELLSGIVFFAEEAAMLAFVEHVRDESRASQRSSAIPTSTEREPESPPARINARAIEFIDRYALDAIRTLYPQIPDTAEGGAIWFEQECNADVSDALLETWYAVISQNNILADETWIGLDSRTQEEMRRFRHAVPATTYEEIVERGIVKLSTDIAVPDQHFRTMFAFYRAELEMSGLLHRTWGHIGNSHLHVNLLAANEAELEKAHQIYHRFIEKAIQLGGTVSAEHGIGKIKRDYLAMMFGSAGLEGFRSIRHAFDPRGILSRGNMML